METTETTLTPVPEAPKHATAASAFAAKLEELKTREGYTGNSFADKLEDEGIPVEVKPKSEAAKASEAATGDPAPKPVEDAADDGSEGVDAVLGALSGAKASVAAEQSAKAALEQRALALGVPAGMAKTMAYRSSQAETETYLSQLEAKGHTGGAGQAVPTADSAATSRAAVGASPGIEKVLIEGGLEEDTASAIAAEFGALRAKLAEVEGRAATAESFTVESTRSQARGDFDAAVGELSGDFPGLVQGSGIDAQVGQIAKGLLATPVYEGNLKGALRAACGIRFPGASGEPRQENNETPRPTTLAPGAVPPASSKPLHPSEGFARLAQTAAKYQNDPKQLAAHLAQQASRIRAQNDTGRRRA
jgi:hypothetical protein